MHWYIKSVMSAQIVPSEHGMQWICLLSKDNQVQQESGLKY